MKFVEFFNNTQGKRKKLGEVQLERGKLMISKDLVPYWNRSWSYGLLAGHGYETMYDPERILYALPAQFKDPEFEASEVMER